MQRSTKPFVPPHRRMRIQVRRAQQLRPVARSTSRKNPSRCPQSNPGPPHLSTSPCATRSSGENRPRPRQCAPRLLLRGPVVAQNAGSANCSVHAMKFTIRPRRPWESREPVAILRPHLSYTGRSETISRATPVTAPEVAACRGRDSSCPTAGGRRPALRRERWCVPALDALPRRSRSARQHPCSDPSNSKGAFQSAAKTLPGWGCGSTPVVRHKIG